MKKNIYLLFSLLILSLVLTGCKIDDKVVDEANKDNEVLEEEVEEEEELSEEEKQKILEEERAELEKARKEELGEFYVPLPALGEENELKTVKAKALYLTGNIAGFNFDQENIDYYVEYINALNGSSGKAPDESRVDEINKLEKVLAIAEATEINSLVIDVKNDSGHVTWNSDVGIVQEVNSHLDPRFADYHTLMDYLREKDIYTIARVVAFKDPFFAESKPEHAIQLTEGGVYFDRAGESWVNPFDKYVWDYVVSLSKEAALRGFDEIQYDYVRFPDGASRYNPITTFPGRDDRKKDEGIEDFLAYAREELQPYNVHVAADVFGIVTRSWDDIPDDIGQTWRKVANNSDYICPMIYPSHYGPGLYGYDVPDKHPYEIAKLAVMEGIERNAAQKNPGLIRPWFQGFSAPWVKGHIKYDGKAISDQMVAAWELGVEEYIIWNAGNNYNPMSFFYHDRINKKEDENLDRLERTPEEALEIFLKAERDNRHSIQYLLTPIGDRAEDFDDFVVELKKTNSVLNSYTINSVEKAGGKGYKALVDVSYSSDKGKFSAENAEFEIIEENQVFKVRTVKKDWIADVVETEEAEDAEDIEDAEEDEDESKDD